MAKRKPKQRALAEHIDGPTVAQLANGDYASALLPDPHLNRTARVHLNRGGTTLARWERDNRLSETQLSAIGHCARLWDRVGLRQRLTASYGERMPGGGDTEAATVGTLQARDDLYRIIDYFPGPLRTYFGVFENICRHDMPAGVAGSNLCQSNRTAEARAHQVVCFVADIIHMKERL